eukprot:c19968_g1_i1 orf=152-2131(+)
MSSVSEHAGGFDPMHNSLEQQKQATSKKKRNLPGTPDPHAEVIALSPRTLMATNRFVCEVCGKGFQRDQNLQLHRRGHNLPWKLKQREDQEIRKRVYVCPETSCVHHDPSRALGDLTGIKKHFFRKHGDKKWKCEKCAKKYAVQSDWKAHQKVCGTREYRCDCGTLFSRRDSFITHRAFCDALAEESAKISVCNQVEGQQCSDPDGNGAVRVSSAIEASSSPFSQLTSGALDSEPSVKEASRLISGVEEGGVDSLALKYGSEMKAFRPNKGPALSLCLGTGPGPGPPGSLQMMGCLPHADNMLSMNKVGVLGPGSDEATHWPASSSGLGMFASMLNSTNNDSETWRGYPSTNSNSEPWRVHSLGEQANNSVAGISMNTDHSFRNSALSQFAPPSSGNISNSSFFGNGYLPSKPSSYHGRHSGSAQLPATALLQKAAMMGATSNNQSLFHSFGGDSSVLARKDSGQETSLGVSSSLSSSWPSLPNEKLSVRCRITDSGHGYGAQQAEGSIYSGLHSGQGSVQEFLNSYCCGGMFQSRSDDTQPGVSNGRGSMQGESRHHQLMGSSDFMLGGLKCQDGSTLAGLGGGSQGGNKYEGSRTTLDFLGIGGAAGGMSGTTTSMARTLSQRDIASITTLSAGIKREPVTPKKGNMPTTGEGAHFS